jgi:predicted enzyme related to lactoylglutathione lyase
MGRFFHYALRTIDVVAARTFYAAVLGNDAAEIFPLHERARARGAPPHWLGFLDVGDVEASLSAFVLRGASSLAPTWVNPQGIEAAVVRDPGGAVVALAKPPATAVPAGGAIVGPHVAWHLLNTANLEQAKANYGELLGWEFGAPLPDGGHGLLHPFAMEPGGSASGALVDIQGRAGVHPHWLFHFRVDALAPALEMVRAGGGSSLGPFALPSGDHVAVCDDPQGAAFGLFATH